MTYEINNFSDIDKNKIKLGKTFKYSSNDNYNLTNIYYLNDNNTDNIIDTKIKINESKSQSQNAVDDKTKLIIQTPLMYLPNSIIYFNDKPFLELSFNNEENDKDVNDFKQWIINLEYYIYKLIKKRTSLNISKDNMISIIKQKNVNYKNSTTKILVPININISKCILNNDLKKSKFLLNWEIPVPTYGISIIWIKNIWIKNNKWGINLFMYASRVMNSHLLDPIDCLGIDTKSITKYDITTKFKNNEKMSIEVGQIPEYSMFFKMLKVGIPKDAIKQKIELAGLDKRIIEYPETAPYTTVLHYISNPHLGSYVKNNNISRDTTSNSNVINNTIPINSVSKPTIKLDLLNTINKCGFKLKKVDINENETRKMKDKLLTTIINNGLKVPSLNDIQGALSKLKKIDLEC